VKDDSRVVFTRKNDSRVTFTRKNGFTLMELLVVVVIMGIVLSRFMSINFSFGDASDELRQETVRLLRLLEFTNEQAVVRAEEYGLRLNESRYRFMKMNELTGKWEDLKQDKLFRERELPEHMSFELDLEDVGVILDEEDADNDDPEVEIKPQIFLLSSGELTPDFVIRLRIAGFDDEYELHGRPTGQFELKEPENE
jgi:general secretion pathway protein H